MDIVGIIFIILFTLVYISEYKCWPNYWKEVIRIKKINKELEKEKKSNKETT